MPPKKNPSAGPKAICKKKRKMVPVDADTDPKFNEADEDGDEDDDEDLTGGHMNTGFTEAQ